MIDRRLINISNSKNNNAITMSVGVEKIICLISKRYQLIMQMEVDWNAWWNYVNKLKLFFFFSPKSIRIFSNDQVARLAYSFVDLAKQVSRGVLVIQLSKNQYLLGKIMHIVRCTFEWNNTTSWNTECSLG